MKKGGGVPLNRRTGSSRRLETSNPTAHIYCSDPHDWHLALKTGEVKCVVQSLDILYDMILESDNLGQELVSQGIVEDIISLPKNSYPYYNGVRYRFLSKLLIVVPDVRNKLKKDSEFTMMAMEDALRTDDTPLRAYGLQYVACMTEDDTNLLKIFVEKYDMKKVASEFLVDLDVDVQNNALALLINLLKNEEMAQSLDEFKMDPLCPQVACPYPDIQNKALDIIEIMTSCKREKYLKKQAAFINVGGIGLLMTVLFIFQWRDLHPKCLRILLNLAANSQHLVHFVSVQGISKLVDYLSFIENEELKSMDLDILYKIATFEEGKLDLVRNGAIPALIEVLEKKKEDTVLKASNIIKLLSEDSTSVQSLSKYNPIPILIEMITNKENSCEMRCHNAATVNALVKNVPVCTLKLSEETNFRRLEELLTAPFSFEIDCLSQVLEAMSTVLSYPTHLNKLINITLSQNLLCFLQNHYKTHPVLAIYGAELLSWTLYREKGRELFISLGGVSHVMKILYRSKNSNLLNSLGLLLKVAFNDQLLTECFIREGVDSWLFTSHELWKTCENLAEAAKFLLDKELSLKFHYTSRLEIWDRIKDGFYICRLLDSNEDFPLIKDLIYNDLSTFRPIFYVNTVNHPPVIKDSTSILDLAEGSKDEEHMHGFTVNTSSLDIAKRCRESVLKRDHKLITLISKVKSQLSSTNNVENQVRLDFNYVQKCVLIIGKIVAEAMSGMLGTGECNNHVFELHVSQLKYNLETSLIPLGFLEIGLKLERAFLFKVLADTVDLPCALVRGDYSTGWVEVATQAPVEQILYKNLPDKKLATNYLVDLMEDPGKLIPLHSQFAKEYCVLQNRSLVPKFPRKLKPGRSIPVCEPKNIHRSDST